MVAPLLGLQALRAGSSRANSPRFGQRALLVAGGLAVVAGGLIYFNLRRSESGPVEGEQLVIDDFPDPEFRAIRSGVTNVAAPGQVLRVDLSQLVQIVQYITIRNKSTFTAWVNYELVLRDRTPTPDQLWVLHEPGRGVTFNFPANGGVAVGTVPNTKAIPFNPGQSAVIPAIIQMQGPGVSQAHSTWWADFDRHRLQYEIEVFEMDGELATTGQRILSRSYLDVELDLVVLA